MIRRPPRSTRTTHSFPTRRSSDLVRLQQRALQPHVLQRQLVVDAAERVAGRSEEHTSELQSLMRISYAVFCLKKKNKQKINHYNETQTHYTTNKVICNQYNQQ